MSPDVLQPALTTQPLVYINKQKKQYMNRHITLTVSQQIHTAFLGHISDSSG